MALAGCASVSEKSATTSRPATRPWMDRSLPPEKRAELLVAQMTLDEKILEIHMLDVREHPREH
jgi:beta-glucosidase